MIQLEIEDELPLMSSEFLGLRLFTQSPYPEFEFIVTPTTHEYCANQSLYAYIRSENFWLKYVDITPSQVLTYATEQLAILRYNNPSITPTIAINAFYHIAKWGSENPLTKIAYATIESVAISLWEADNYADVINFTHKTVWYADHIMKPIRFLGESWRDYALRVRSLKIKARTAQRNREIKQVVTEESLSLQCNSGGIIPTPQILNQATTISVRKIKEVTEENRIWQSKGAMHKQIIQNLTKHRKLTQKELALELGLSERQVRKILNQ